MGVGVGVGVGVSGGGLLDVGCWVWVGVGVSGWVAVVGVRECLSEWVLVQAQTLVCGSLHAFSV